MIICEFCNVPMKYVMHFEGQKAYRFRRCPKCFYETRMAPLNLEEEKQTQQSENEKKKGGR